MRSGVAGEGKGALTGFNCSKTSNSEALIPHLIAHLISFQAIAIECGIKRRMKWPDKHSRAYCLSAHRISEN